MSKVMDDNILHPTRRNLHTHADQVNELLHIFLLPQSFLFQGLL